MGGRERGVVEPLTIVSSVFGVVTVAGILLIAYLWNGYNSLQVENERLQAQITTLLSLLEHYLAAEKQVAQNPVRQGILDEILAEVRKLQQQAPRGDVNVSLIGQGADVGQAAAGKGLNQEK